jgi:hypothetical protein
MVCVRAIPSTVCIEATKQRETRKHYVAVGSFSEVDARIGEVCFAPVNGLRQSGLSGPKSANSGLMRRRRVPLFDHLVDIGELLGQPRFAKTLNHQLRSF